MQQLKKQLRKEKYLHSFLTKNIFQIMKSIVKKMKILELLYQSLEENGLNTVSHKRVNIFK